MLWPLCSLHLTDVRVSIECKFECGVALNFVQESFAHQAVKPTRPTTQIPDLPFSLNAFESPADQKYNSALLETYPLTLLIPLVRPGELEREGEGAVAKKTGTGGREGDGRQREDQERHRWSDGTNECEMSCVGCDTEVPRRDGCLGHSEAPSPASSFRGVKEKQTHACRFCHLQPTPPTPPPPPPAREPAGVQGSSCRRCLGSSSRFRAPQKERCVRPVAVAALGGGGGGGTRCTLENERPLVLCAPPMSSAVLYQSQGCSTPGFHPQAQIIVLFFVCENVEVRSSTG